MIEKKRCLWSLNDPLYRDYHDTEWGVPLHDDRALFELLMLEGAQAGLSWLTILRKREAYRLAFDNFDMRKVALYGEEKIAELLGNAGIVRNKLKVRGTVRNAQAAIRVADEFGSLDAYLWRFLDGRPKQNKWKDMGQVPARTEESDVLSKDLLKRDFTFVGSTICYAFMQASGMVNDHLTSCFRHRALRR